MTDPISDHLTGNLRERLSTAETDLSAILRQNGDKAQVMSKAAQEINRALDLFFEADLDQVGGLMLPAYLAKAHWLLTRPN